MSKFGDDLIESLEDAHAHARGKPSISRTRRVPISGQDVIDVMQRSPLKGIELVAPSFPMLVRDVEL